MQTTGHIKINGETLLVLVRQKRFSRQLKLRKSGKPGTRFQEEEDWLREHPDDLARLLRGETVEI